MRRGPQYKLNKRSASCCKEMQWDGDEKQFVASLVISGTIPGKAHCFATCHLGVTAVI